VYYNSVFPIYKSLYEIKPFFEFSKVVQYEWKRPEARLIELRKSTNDEPPVILVHGIDPREINGEWTEYKTYFVNTWKRYLPDGYGLYIYIYPSLDIPLEESAQKLVKEVLKLSQRQSTQNRKFNFYAHSMGGLLVRYALQDEKFVKCVNKIIFAATPHIGSPLANFVVMDKRFLILRKDWNLIKSILIGANISGVFIQAPNYRYLIYGSKHPEIPHGVDYINFAGFIERKVDVAISNIAQTEPFSTAGMLILNTVTAMLFNEGDFTANDGMVPLVSAIETGKSVIFNGFDHADFILSDIIVNRAVEFFYGDKN